MEGAGTWITPAPAFWMPGPMYDSPIPPGAPMARKRGTGIPGLSFSWRRALGVSQAQAKLSRQIGIPLSRGGRQRKLGRLTGCALPLALLAGAGWSLWRCFA